MKAPSDTVRARILVVDDHAFMRVAMGAILGKGEILKVVGEAKDGKEAPAPWYPTNASSRDAMRVTYHHGHRVL
jgi:DNA-binding NarL/FixJ family response regulator